MRRADVDIYRCPGCGSDRLSLSVVQEGGAGEVEVGELRCERCDAHYPVARGLPRFVGADNYAASFGLQWNLHRKTQLDSHTGLPISRDRVFAATGWPADLRGERMLEAGSGAGRFTEVLLSTGASLVSFDYSGAVDANRQNNGDRPGLTLFQGDIYRIPLEPESFDRVLCFGVLQHTPDPAGAFASLARFVRPGGRIAIDVYRADLPALLQWKYLLRPLTRRMGRERLYRLVEAVTPAMIPLARGLRRAGARLVPIVEYSHLGLSPELNRQWAILDTFDMYSPAHDHPQSLAAVRRWFDAAGLVEVDVRRGPNGVVGNGRRPA